MDRITASLVMRETRQYLATPARDINLVDVAEGDDGPMLRFHVGRPLLPPLLAALGLDALPHELAGVPRAIVVGTYQLERFWSWGSPTRERRDPMVGGISISRADRASTGTLGALVHEHQNGEPLLLSNFHVLAGQWGMRPGTLIVQPGLADGGNQHDVVGAYQRDAMEQHLDAAVADLSAGRPLDAVQQGIGPYHGHEPPRLGQRVVKCGRTSGTTYGIVSGFAGQAYFTYGSVRWRIQDIVTIDPVDAGTIVSEPGDSGACWLDADSKAAVALHFAGSDAPQRALAVDLGPVCAALDVELPS